MYTINTKDLEKIEKRMREKGFGSLMEKQKEIFAKEISSIKIINTREVFVFSFMFWIYYRTTHSVLIQLASNKTFICDLTTKELNKILELNSNLIT
jgi:hypothetical protein